ncbi:hypothetical protein [Azospirillum brasilense]|uniref:Transmembrane protein n=1 Tax=Azospirillum brasilense TaxID=192 RepID=A0A6L3ARS9_AZOBR|nr:hypothetical protein [Azospirillum brasilense]KAA0677439.1 hypothetical protein DS837_29255 [Azospirillum brasilense]
MNRLSLRLWCGAPFVLAYFLALFLFVPWEPFHKEISSIDVLSVDAAFIIALPELFKSGAQYGPDVVFTYGPWGILATAVVPQDLHTVVLLLRAAFALIAAHIAATLIVRNAASRSTQTVLAAGLLVLSAFWIAGLDQAFWLFPTFFVGIVGIVRRDPRETGSGVALVVLAVMASSWIGLIKFNFFVLGLCVQIILLCLDLAARRLPLLFAIWVATTAAAWVAAGQRLANLPSWVLACMDLSGGYADAMAKGFFTPYPPLVVAVLAGALLGFVATAFSIAARLQNRSAAVAVSAVCVLAAGVAWQHAIGGNQMEQAVGEVLVAVWFLVAMATWRTGGAAHLWWPAAALPLVTVGLFALLIGVWSSFSIMAELKNGLGRKVTAAVSAIDGRLFSGPDPWDALMAGIRRNIPVDVDVQGTADIYPQHTAVVIADPRLRYAPRPAYLSLNAHTARLVERNADHLRDDPPQVVLFQILNPSRAVDNRHPATADGLSWPELLTRYGIVNATDEFLVLGRLEHAISHRFVPLPTRRIRWGEDIRLDAGPKLLWARLHIAPSPIGRIVKAVYKAPHAFLEETLANGGKREYQIVPALGEAGFLLSPLVADTPSFARLMQATVASPVNPANVVTSLRIRTEPGTDWFWSPEVGLDLFELSVDGAGRSLPDRLATGILLADLRANVESCLFPPSIETDPELAKSVSILHAPCAARLPVPPQARGMTLSYGLRCAPLGGASDGAELTVSGLGPSGDLVFSQRHVLDPANRPADCSEQALRLVWPGREVRDVRIAFSPGPHGDPSYDHTYVSSVAFTMDGP